jgi:hypothetical protein
MTMAFNEAVSGTCQIQCWAVRPCTHPLAFGVPLFCYWDEDGRLVETAITPLPRMGEQCPQVGEVLASITERPSLQLILDEALEGTPHAVFDAIHAHLVHKWLISPEGESREVDRRDPVAGVLITPEGEIAALVTGMYRDVMGVITVERRVRGADVRVRWVAPWHFTADREGFAVACEGLTHEDLLAGLDGLTPMMAIEGVALLLNDPRRMVPNLVAGALITRVIAELGDTHPARCRGLALLDQIEMAEGHLSAADYVDYTDALALLRQLLVLVADKRQLGKEPLYDELACRPSWQDLYESIVDAMVRVHRVLDGRAPERNLVRSSIEQVALTSRDAYSEKMRSLRGRIVSGIGDLAAHPQEGRAGESELESRFRYIARLLGTSGWEIARPYEAGVLAAAIGGW